jgi:hypothetical protein
VSSFPRTRILSQAVSCHLLAKHCKLSFSLCARLQVASESNRLNGILIDTLIVTLEGDFDSIGNALCFCLRVDLPSVLVDHVLQQSLVTLALHDLLVLREVLDHRLGGEVLLRHVALQHEQQMLRKGPGRLVVVAAVQRQPLHQQVVALLALEADQHVIPVGQARVQHEERMHTVIGRLDVGSTDGHKGLQVGGRRGGHVGPVVFLGGLADHGRHGAALREGRKGAQSDASFVDGVTGLLGQRQLVELLHVRLGLLVELGRQ